MDLNVKRVDRGWHCLGPGNQELQEDVAPICHHFHGPTCGFVLLPGPTTLGLSDLRVLVPKRGTQQKTYLKMSHGWHMSTQGSLSEGTPSWWSNQLWSPGRGRAAFTHSVVVGAAKDVWHPDDLLVCFLAIPCSVLVTKGQVHSIYSLRRTWFQELGSMRDEDLAHATRKATKTSRGM